MPLDPIKFRTTDMTRWGVGLGHNLDALDFDLNNWNFDQRLVALETADPPEAVGIEDFSFVGNIMTVHMTDSSTRGPYAIAVGWVLRGPWEAGETYLSQNLFIGPADTPYYGNAYLVNINHVAAPTFDPDATDGSSHKLVSLLLPAAVPAVPINDVHVFVSGIMNDAQLILRYQSIRVWTMAANLIGSLFLAGTPANAETIVALYQNSTLIGTLTWAVGAVVPTVFFQFRVDFDVGDLFEVRGPSVSDTTLADVSFDFVGNRL